MEARKQERHSAWVVMVAAAIVAEALARVVVTVGAHHKCPGHGIEYEGSSTDQHRSC